MSKTSEYLKKAINGESTAAEKYGAYSRKAADEGYTNIAALFKALEEAENVHIKNHKQALGDPDYIPEIGEYKTGMTTDNLKDALAGETWEYKKMYPSFIRAVKSELKEEYAKVGRLSMLWASKVEQKHAKLIKSALKDLKAGRDFHITDIYVCRVCGNLETGGIPEDTCPVCGHDPMFYRLANSREE